ncbi:ArsA family ATPase [Halalkalibacterium halodurans]|uniref:Arsenical pump-driving ATPase n=1 Tax=Halalkalibacterium halodurans (strain ATCC BAA-125 / DSM 18197 / FERM 7344 / JCM 9153 / C-125) TaxID=272558 RepID=Q9KBX9_HALH5|nr:ArsA family ATPase [Halalkalibacterium halodurans]MDY7222355.1 ArsA family ATPase [Halalkalibacterium halodurans]MDY7241576.1 ArsA family ATPase [Halalkalibacterium halodurans]MED4082338.1 ArsA family ATPase [Halalkalibacterium halodurans]MED4083511.1 ArsA family ATPase [Halalkalibacterium halodurans]MED4105824.1 ArsA family ATPase [Halalkalibacterium halodurans]
MLHLYTKHIYFIGGKGGVGKSTSAASFAWRCAERGEKTLLISTDPAHNLGDLFHTEIGAKHKKITDNLFATEIDPEQETRRYIQSVKDNLRGMVKSTMLDEVNRQIDAAAATPGADEAAMFNAISSIVLDEQGTYDKLVFDTAPTGHTIRLLTLPEMMGVWIDGMVKKRKKINENYSNLLNDGEPVDDPIYDTLQQRKERFAAVRNVLLDPKKTGFMFVLIPERLPILETEKAVKLLAKHDLHVETLIINKILPDVADGQFLEKRRQIEQRYLQQIHNTFRKQTLLRVPLFPEDIGSIEALYHFARYLEPTAS